MSESFLHYIWQFQYFDKKDLKTTQGETVQIFNPGMRNGHAGPDFFNARVMIDNIEWIGSIEVHINASGWFEHNHDTDHAYENVVLHVVWKSDKPVKRNDGTLLPAIELRNRVDEKLLLNYKKLVNSPEAIPCARSMADLNEITRLSMLDKALSYRLEDKSRAVLKLYERNGNNWDETCYQMLSKNFGFKVNADPFLQLSQSVQYKTLLKHSDKLYQVEALLFGQAGFLEDISGDEYFTLLLREYRLLSQKYRINQKTLNKAQWRFLRLRPANFPTIRIAQFAALLHSQNNIFSRILESTSHKSLKELFTVSQSDYWLHHYQFDGSDKESIPPLGEMSIDNIIINTVVPLLAAYGKLRDEQEYVDRAVQILHEIQGEENSITRQWTALGISMKTAFDSQASIELYNHFCMKRRCLECNIGAALIKPVNGWQ